MTSPLTARAVNAIKDIGQANWDSCAGDDNPFTSYAFLAALEESGSVTPETGWAPYHVVVENPGGGILGCAPAYAKSHSQGEYVFDHNWAHAFEQAGGHYYPKLLMGVPFSPVTGPRLLAPDLETRDLLLSGSVQLADRMGVSSLHILFPTFEEWEAMGGAGLLLRKDQQFIWHNAGYDDFDGFLDALSSRKRKNIRKERSRALENGIEIEIVTGSDLCEHHWDAFYEFYLDTSGRKWGRAYLNRLFFSLIGESMPENIVLIMCKRDGRYIGGALNLLGKDALFGRNWGCIEDHACLHFEACYYQAIEFAISRKLDRVEAGAQGPHKLARGYMPHFTYSAHWIADPAFREAVANFLRQEGNYVEADQRALEAHGPFKHAGAAG